MIWVEWVYYYFDIAGIIIGIQCFCLIVIVVGSFVDFFFFIR